MLDDDHLSLDLWLKHCLDYDLYAAIERASADSPRTFAELVRRREEFDLALEDFAEHAGRLWVLYGDVILSRDEWRELFDAAGYRVDGEPAVRPSQSLLLWRGATPAFRANWSWAEQHDSAHMYASGWSGVQDEVGLVWRAVVEPWRLLARMKDGCTVEHLVDTRDLTIEPHSLWCRCPVDLTPFRQDDRQAQVALDLHELVTCTRALRPPHDL